MKRLMMMVAMMAFVLLLPMNAEAAGETVIEGDWVQENNSVELNKDTIIKGNFIASDMSHVSLTNCVLCIEGDLNLTDVADLSIYGNSKVIVEGNVNLISCDNIVSIDSNASFEVKGNVYTDYMDIDVENGTLIIEGDLSLIKGGNLVAEEDGIIRIDGDIISQPADGWGGGKLDLTSNTEIMVGGDILVESATGYWNCGKMNLKGDFIVEKSDANSYAWLDVVLDGNELQTINLPKKWSFHSINFANQEVKICGYFNGHLGSDVTGVTFEDDILRTTGLWLNGYNVTIHGDVFAEGEFYVNNNNYDCYNPTSSFLVVEGDYVQLSNQFKIDSMTGYNNISILGDLRLQSVDEDGNYVTGSGKIRVSSGMVGHIGGDIIIDTTENMRDEVSGTLYVAGDILQLSKTVFNLDHVILNGTEPQSVTLLRDTAQISTQSMIDTLELTQERKHYTFNPEPCWNTLIQLEGIRNTAEGFKYYEDGNWISDAYKYVKYDGATFLVANGVVATGINGIAQDPLNPQDWYFLSGGQVQEQHTGLAEYDGQWFYVENGKLDTTMNQCIEYDGALFMLAEGRIISETSGLVMDPKSGNWYFLADGQAKIEYTGLAFYDETWFYVEKGILAEGFTGKVKYDGQYFNVVNGMVK